MVVQIPFFQSPVIIPSDPFPVNRIIPVFDLGISLPVLS